MATVTIETGHVVSVVAVLLAAALLFRIIKFFMWFVRQSPSSTTSSIVVITGCDSGFGRGLALRLHNAGWVVVAGCLTETGREQLEADMAGGASVATLLDVTVSSSVQALRAVTEEVIADTQLQLRAVVCNAGILAGFVTDLTPLSMWKKVMDVNTIGVVDTAKTFMPLVMRDRSRIVVVSSVAGFTSVPGFGAYTASKHATASFADTLRRELKPWGVTVSNIQPGVMRTPLVVNANDRLEELWSKADKSARDRWGEEWFERFMKGANAVEGKVGGNPSTVVDALEHAITGVFPKKRYLIGFDACLVFWPLSFLPAGVSDALFDVFLNGALWFRNLPRTAIGGTRHEKED